jgi:hypothetical protein
MRVYGVYMVCILTGRGVCIFSYRGPVSESKRVSLEAVFVQVAVGRAQPVLIASSVPRLVLRVRAASRKSRTYARMNSEGKHGSGSVAL